jgi:hypothetical protein
MIDWTAIENAIHAWFATATGLETIWASQDAPQPGCPFAMLKRITPGVREHEQDELRSIEDPEAGPGEEIVISVAGPRVFTVSCQVFANSDAPGANADHYLGFAEAALELPSVRRTLRAAHAVPVEIISAQDLDRVAGGRWRSRSNMDVRFRTISSVGERTGYITQTEISGTYTKPDNSTVQYTDTMREAP